MSKKQNNLSVDQQAKIKQEQLLISEVTSDFERRQKERLPLERQWELNMNFLAGNQYCSFSPKGDIAEEDKEYYWQGREVFNHIAPIMETRFAKLARVTPSLSVRPKSDDDKEVYLASVAEKLLEQAFKVTAFPSTVRQATGWSEICGTAFYKVIWKNDSGEFIGELDGEKIREGEVDVLPVSPFEIYPDNLFRDRLDDCRSIIHARAMNVDEILRKYGVVVEGEDIDVYSLAKNSGATFGSKTKNTVSNSAVVIERYELASECNPNGRLVTVCNGKLLYVGELPYINRKDKQRGYPFVKQDSLDATGSFFGKSIIERLIPVQKSFNAVKNRKHEFMNRLSMGIVKVEDGSVDIDDLAEDGLSPGKVVVYRQGSKAPELLDEWTMPSDFDKEEDKLLNEFVAISGVSEVSSSSENAKINSGSALEILISQDNERMTLTAERIRNSYVEVGEQILRLYTQFINGVKTVRYTDNYNKIKTVYADKKTVGSDDIYLTGENELLYSPSQKKEMIYKLYESGLLNDEKGNLRQSIKGKLLTLMGYYDLDYRNGISKLQEEKAQKENALIKKGDLSTEVIDDHAVHIDEHTRYVLSEYSKLSIEEKQRFFNHIEQHKTNIANSENVMPEQKQI